VQAGASNWPIDSNNDSYVDGRDDDEIDTNPTRYSRSGRRIRTSVEKTDSSIGDRARDLPFALRRTRPCDDPDGFELVLKNKCPPASRCVPAWSPRVAESPAPIPGPTASKDSTCTSATRKQAEAQVDSFTAGYNQRSSTNNGDSFRVGTNEFLFQCLPDGQREKSCPSMPESCPAHLHRPSLVASLANKGNCNWVKRNVDIGRSRAWLGW